MKIVCTALLALTAAMQSAAPAAADLADFKGVGLEFRPRVESKRAPYFVSMAVNGNGKYVEFAGTAADAPPPQPHHITVSDATLAVLLAVRTAVHPGACETRHKGIASDGKKKFTVFVGDSSVACEFGYSDDARLNAAADKFEAIAAAFEFAERLEHEHRFDRLGLDAELDALVAENSAGRAIELQNIADTLQSIAGDDRVIQRVRVKAARLLQDAGVPVDAVNAR